MAASFGKNKRQNSNQIKKPFFTVNIVLLNLWSKVQLGEFSLKPGHELLA
jgi:hypothetical protein